MTLTQQQFFWPLSILCVSENVLYAVYLGETGRRLGDRFTEHLRSTWLPDTDLPVGRHLTFPGHNVDDTLLSVICSCLNSTTERRSLEARMIFRHRKLDPAGMNVDFEPRKFRGRM